MEELYEALSQMATSGEKLSFTQNFFMKFYQAFLYNERWKLYLGGVGTTLLVTACALIFGILLGIIVALVVYCVLSAVIKNEEINPIAKMQKKLNA